MVVCSASYIGMNLKNMLNSGLKHRELRFTALDFFLFDILLKGEHLSLYREESLG